jgi:hypothetical protein
MPLAATVVRLTYDGAILMHLIKEEKKIQKFAEMS